ncbi:MAG: FeoA domain-containing protein [Chloroflexi bacterium]|nr:FeoA domain-containing protein [Chloroflexota bacterium]MBK7179842.1 FeoA domain-containing protein [Chloroflexota bacterium]MBK8932783.1 FeoA domain-containing protein [Chloroflexota bacterium]MBP6804818.1 FeoA domain-containing protein [Chloroflexota bacterium]MBP7593761.1 FeoA domain-containing protein [Chloroflexota bacterium]
MPDPLIALSIATGLLGLTAVLFWPERGLWARWQHARHLNERVQSEDALKHIYKCEMKGRRPTLESIAGVIHASLDNTAELLSAMETNKFVSTLDGDIHLTPAGREAALHIIRAHRLWEHYLAEETGFEEAEWHGRAERLEHALTPEQVDELASQLGNPIYDPHGDPIPTASGQLISHGGQPLTKLPLGTPGRIVHLEDEPAIVYAQLVAEGLYPGMPVRIIEISSERVRFWANGDEHLLAPMLAANISVVAEPVTAEQETEEPLSPDSDTLNSLPIGAYAEVLGIANKCRGAERRRFMDLGILPGTKIKAEMRSPSGDPTAYIIRDALIALRQEQASLIRIRKPQAEAQR